MGETPLSIKADHPKRASRAPDSDRDWPAGWPLAARPDHADAAAFFWGPTWRLYLEYWRIVRRHVPARGERLRCYGCLMGWLLVNGNGARLLIEPIAAIGLRLGAGASEIGRRLQGMVRAARMSVAGLRPRQR